MTSDVVVDPASLGSGAIASEDFDGSGVRDGDPSLGATRTTEVSAPVEDVEGTGAPDRGENLAGGSPGNDAATQAPVPFRHDVHVLIDSPTMHGYVTCTEPRCLYVGRKPR